MCRFGTARALLDQPDWTRPYQQYADTPGGTYWCTAVADAGDHEPFAVAIGTPYEHVKWFRGPRHRQRLDIKNVATRTAAPCLRRRWPTVGRVHSALLAAGGFPGVDQPEVLNCLSGTKPRIAK